MIWAAFLTSRTASWNPPRIPPADERPPDWAGVRAARLRRPEALFGGPEAARLRAEAGLEIVVPHRAQRAALQQSFPELCIIDPASGLPSRSAIDTVERFQGGERTAILVSATESDRAYLLASSAFLLDPRRLTVAVSRAKRKMILVASRNIFSMFSPDEETFTNSLLWKNLLLKTCSTRLWAGERDGKQVVVWGGKS